MEVRSTRQPHPFFAPIGDCGACCVSGVTGMSVEEVYEFLKPHRGDYAAGKPKGDYCTLGYSTIIFMLQELGLAHENFLPAQNIHTLNPEYFPFGSPSHFNSREWEKLSKDRVRKGMVGIAQVNFDGQAHMSQHLNHNHFVIIYDLEDVETEHGSRTMVKVSCSVKGEYQVEAREFLWRFGGYNAIWVKPLKQ